MDHVAIMKKSWGLIPKILSGVKTVESRWYQTRRAPWNAARAGERVYFKNAGEPITAKARISEVLQFEVDNIEDVERITRRYGKDIALVNADPRTWSRLPKYCILLRLESPSAVEPFNVSKKGFGTGAAWLTVPDVHAIRTP